MQIQLVVLLLLFVSVMHRTFCYADNNIYVQASVGTGFVGNFPTSIPSNGSYTYALGVSGGYMFNKYFTVNGGINYVPYYSANLYMADVAVRGSLPLSSFVSVYWEFGPGVLTTNHQVTSSTRNIISNTATTAFAPYSSVGAIFKINDCLGINVNDYGYFPMNSGNSPINMINLGVYYAF